MLNAVTKIVSFLDPSGIEPLTSTMPLWGLIKNKRHREQKDAQNREANESKEPMETINQLFNEYMNRHSRRFKKSWREDSYNFQKHIAPILGNREIRDIHRADIEVLHGAFKSKFVANKCVALLSSMFNRAIAWGRVEKNPAASIKKYPEKSREVYLPKSEADEFFKIVMKQPEPYYSIFMFLICTGCRKSEALKLQWRNVNYSNRTVTFEDTKNGRDHTVPVDDKVLTLIASQPKDNDFVFNYQGNPLKDLRRPWKKIITEYDKGHYMIKDLRKSLASWLAQQGESLYLIGGILNHKDPRATMVYAKFQVEHLRTPIQKTLKDLDFSQANH